MLIILSANGIFIPFENAEYGEWENQNYKYYSCNEHWCKHSICMDVVYLYLIIFIFFGW